MDTRINAVQEVCESRRLWARGVSRVRATGRRLGGRARLRGPVVILTRGVRRR
jgi:hypothetical protein